MTAASGSKRHIAIGTATLCVLLGALDTYVVVSLFFDILNDMRIPANRLERATPIVTAYLLGYIAAMPLFGQASDRLGRKPLLQASLALFLIGSVMTALAEDVDALTQGRLVQGIAAGALLPITMALVGDLFAQRKRANVLGGVGAAQELGSVFGPPYGLLVAGFGFWVAVFEVDGWRGVFWINVPLAIAAMVAVQLTVPGRSENSASKVDIVGAGLAALTLGLLVVGLQNPEPDRSYLAPDGPKYLAAAALALVLFVVWEKFARTKLIDPAGVRFVPLFATFGTSVMAGAALMVTLVDIEIMGKTIWGLSDHDTLYVLARFLVALPVGALAGGYLATRIGERAVACGGMVIAGGAYYLIAQWPIDVLSQQVLFVPRADMDLVLAGFGLGLVIAPLSAAALRTVPDTQFGITSSGVVVARMTGMLIGIAALSSFGLHRFQVLTSDLIMPLKIDFEDQETYDRAMNAYTSDVKAALVTEYHEIFTITALICLVGAVIAVFIGARRTTRASQRSEAE